MLLLGSLGRHWTVSAAAHQNQQQQQQQQHVGNTVHGNTSCQSSPCLTCRVVAPSALLGGCNNCLTAHPTLVETLLAFVSDMLLANTAPPNNTQHSHASTHHKNACVCLLLLLKPCRAVTAAHPGSPLHSAHTVVGVQLVCMACHQSMQLQQITGGLDVGCQLPADTMDRDREKE